MRACEVNRLSGIPHYLAATILAISIFPKPVAILSILYLALGDPIASLIGILYGSEGPRFASGKSLVGTTAGVLTCALATGLFLKTSPVSSLNWMLLTVVGGLAGGLAELVPLEVDDNFSIPVISGFVLWLAFILIGF
jgi:dolichol kinase